MIGNLRLTTDRNTEQDWLKTNLAKLTSMLQGQRNLTAVGQLLLSQLTPLVNAQQGVIYQLQNDESKMLTLLSAYANDSTSGHPAQLGLGETLIGQCAADKRTILISEMPPNVVPIGSALFKAVPKNVIVLPVLFENQVKAVIELASVCSFTGLQISFLEQLTSSIGIVLNSIEATMQTEGLLKQSQQPGPATHRPTSSWSRRRSSLPSATSTWSARTRRSSRRGVRLKRRQASWRSPRNTSPSSWRTCRTNSGHR
jgi:hypothetical protein